MNNGWIKLNRNIKSHWIWTSNHRLKWWVDILLTVNHAPNKILIGNQLLDCDRGQTLRSLETWAKDWSVTKKTVKDFFKLLQGDGMIVTENLRITTRLTVCNYEFYQRTVNGQETDSKQTGTDFYPDGKQQSTLNKKERKQKEFNKEKEKVNWRENFEIYLLELNIAFESLLKDSAYIETQARLNPGIDVILSLEKAKENYWATEDGWVNKKSKKTESINWKSTFANSINFNNIKIKENNEIHRSNYTIRSRGSVEPASIQNGYTHCRTEIG